jgi:hypothetical protein
MSKQYDDKSVWDMIEKDFQEFSFEEMLYEDSELKLKKMRKKKALLLTRMQKLSKNEQNQKLKLDEISKKKTRLLTKVENLAKEINYQRGILDHKGLLDDTAIHSELTMKQIEDCVKKIYTIDCFLEGMTGLVQLFKLIRQEDPYRWDGDDPRMTFVVLDVIKNANILEMYIAETNNTETRLIYSAIQNDTKDSLEERRRIHRKIVKKLPCTTAERH